MEEQRSVEWFRKRLGYFTGSRVGDLMKSSKTTGVFGDTAKAYIYQIAAERDMNKNIVNDDDAMKEYIESTSITSKSIRFGIDNEDDARVLYCKLKKALTAETGSTRHPNIPFFASSPDGLIVDKKGLVIGCLEIKCPDQKTFIKYRLYISDNASLKKVMPGYYWQCQSHMMCTNTEWCDFIVYCPWQSNPIHIVRITADYKDFDSLERRVILANEYVDNINNNIA